MVVPSLYSDGNPSKDREKTSVFSTDVMPGQGREEVPPSCVLAEAISSLIRI